MKLLVASSEAVPFAKSSGLADFVTGLSSGLAGLGHEVTLMLPFFRRHIRDSVADHPALATVSVPIGDHSVTGSLFETRLPTTDVRVLLIDQPGYFDRPALYSTGGRDYPDNCERFVFFCRAVLEASRILGINPDVVHANDWQTGLIPALVAIEYRRAAEFERTAAVFTIHNLAHQGLFPNSTMSLTGLDWRYFNWRQMEFYGQLNLLKTGIAFADMVTTLSPQYARDICKPACGCGMEGLLAERGRDLVGIFNGIDTSGLSQFSQDAASEDWLARKHALKRELQQRLHVPARPEVPLLGVIGRMVAQKGIDMLAVSAERLLHQDLQLVILGSGEPQMEALLRGLAQRNPDKVAVVIGLDHNLAQQIEAGADIYLMPSQFEPSGLNALNGMLYGTVPIVSATGGLANSVINLTDDTKRDGTATGFTLNEYSADELCHQVDRALGEFRKPDDWAQLVKNNRRLDWSWRRAAAEYVTVYERSLRKQDVAHPLVTAHSARTIPLTVVDTLHVERGRDVARIELCVGDVTAMNPSDGVDVLVVSAFPDDYSPMAGSLIGDLAERGVSVDQLAQNRAVDLRDPFSCWMSSPLDGSNLGFRRILCFEPLRRGPAPERIGDVFRALAPFVLDTPPVRTIAMPILASGYQRQSPTIMLRMLVETAQQFLVNGLPLICLRIVAHPPFFLTEPERADYIARVKQTFAEVKAASPTARMRASRNSSEFRYDLFLSYSRQDKNEVGYITEQLSRSLPDLRLFLDRTELDPGQAWQQEIFSALDSCWKVLSIYSPSYLQSKVCVEELNIALCRAREEERPVVYPIYLYSSRLPTYMRVINFLDCREFDRAKIAAACRSLAQEIQTSR